MDLYGSVTWNVLRYTRHENREKFRMHARTPSDVNDEMKCQRGVVCWLAEAAVKVDTSYSVSTKLEVKRCINTDSIDEQCRG
jgi:hypothetical protein